MHIIGDDTTTADPITGEWSEGGPGGTPPATIGRAAWLNTLQRELIAVVQGSGRTLSATDDAQVAASLAMHVNGIASMRTIAVVSGRSIWRKYHSLVGDGGELNFEGKTGAAPGTYVDNNGTVVVPTGGNGSAAWVAAYSGAVNVKWFNAIGDGVTTGQQVAFNAASVVSRHLYIPPGSYLFSGTWFAQSGSVLRGLKWETTRILRSGVWSGPTLQIGVNTAGLGSYSFEISNLYFEQLHPGFVQGTSTTMLDKLTASQPHIQLYGGTNGKISECWFQNGVYSIRATGCTQLKISHSIFVGSWDDANAAISETEAYIIIENSVIHGISTLNEITSCYVAGGPLVSRSYTLADKTWTTVREGGAKFGILVFGAEGLHVHHNYIGGQNQYSMIFLPTNGDVCSNIDIDHNFFDGALLGNISFSASDASGQTNIIDISHNRFNGQFSCPQVLHIPSNAGAITAAILNFSQNICNAQLKTPLYLFGLKGGKIKGNLVVGYNARGVGSVTPSLADATNSSGCYIGGPSSQVNFQGNTWGGGINDMGSTNDCKWGVVLDGAATNPSTISAGLELGILGRSGGVLLSGITKSLGYNVFGTGAILSNATSVVITHGLGYIPSLGKIVLVGGNLPTNAIGMPYVNNITATTFTVNCADPGASNWTFGWSVAA